MIYNDLKILLCLLASTFAFMGCSGPDRLPIREYVFIENAAVRVEIAPWDPSVKFARVTHGENLVLQILDGFERGRYSTAHSSHQAFFLTMPSDVPVGQTIRCSPDDGTVAFDAFAGYLFRYLDPDAPAYADVTIVDRSATTLRAEVQIRASVLEEREALPAEPINLTKTMIFERAAVEDLYYGDPGDDP